MTKVALVIDDHPVTHIGCRRLLTEAGYGTVLEAGDYATAYRQCDRTPPDLIVLDLGLPGIGGLGMIQPLRERAPGAGILIFSMSQSSAVVAKALAAGASGYVAKDAQPESFLAAVRRIEAGQIYLENDLAIDVAMRSLRGAADPLDTLSARDLQILRLLGDGFGYKEIAGDMNISYKTVANACTAMKQKLAARNLSDLIRIAISQSTGPDVSGEKWPPRSGPSARFPGSGEEDRQNGQQTERPRRRVRGEGDQSTDRQGREADEGEAATRSPSPTRPSPSRPDDRSVARIDGPAKTTVDKLDDN